MTVPGASALERQILEDIECRTGLRYSRIGGIDTSSKEVAEAVLPTALDRLSRLQDCVERQLLQMLFSTRHAKDHIDIVISWWKREGCQDGASDTVGYLTSALALIAGPRTARKIWDVVRGHKGYPSEFFLLVKLASFRATREEVCRALVESLDVRRLRVGDYDTIARAKCSGVQAWFAAPIDQLPPAARSTAERRRRHDGQTPRHRRSRGGPNRAEEAFSIECDPAAVDQALADLGLTTSVKGVQLILNHVLSEIDGDLDTELWRVLERLPSSKHGMVDLWFRLEDLDAVELVILPARNPATAL